MNTDKKWADLNWEEKREVRFRRWLNPSVTFSIPENENVYSVLIIAS